MSHWILADIARESANKVNLKSVRTLTTQERKDLVASNIFFKSVLHRTTFVVLERNYQAFCAVEREALAVATRKDPPNRINVQALRTSLITAVVNYLTSMRMFLDHSQAELTRRDAEDGGKRLDTWKQACSHEYDDYFAYRFLYKFRNYIQHIGLPISNLVVSTRMDANGDVTGRIFLGEAPDHLVRSYDGWSTVGDELKILSTEIDLSDQIHISMECLNRIAEALLQEDIPELIASVNTFERIVGELDSYTGRPLLVKSSEERPVDQSISLDVERYRIAAQITASRRAVGHHPDRGMRRGLRENTTL